SAYLTPDHWLLATGTRSECQPGVPATVREERLSLLLRECEHAAEINVVIAAIVCRIQAAIEPGNRTAENRSARDGWAKRHAAERGVDEGGTVRKAVREEFVVLREDIDGECARFLKQRHEA